MCSGEKHSPTTDAWMQIPDISEPRVHFSTEVTGGLQDATTMNGVEGYDEKSKWIDAKDMNVHVSGLSACVVMCFLNVCDYIQ
jgi:hypothetical protein